MSCIFVVTAVVPVHLFHLSGLSHLEDLQGYFLSPDTVLLEGHSQPTLLESVSHHHQIAVQRRLVVQLRRVPDERLNLPTKQSPI